MPKNTENPRFFEFYKSIKWPESADKHIKTSDLPEILARIFILGPEPKIHGIIPSVVRPKAEPESNGGP